MVAVFVTMVMIVIVSVRMGVPVLRMAVMVVFVVYVLDARRYRHFGDGLRVELLADQQHHGSADQRKQGYQPDLIEKVHVTTSAGRSGRPGLFLCCGTARSECPAPPPLPRLRR